MSAENSQDYKVADISVAEWGRKEIAIAECLPIIDHDSFNVMMDFIIVG